MCSTVPMAEPWPWTTAEARWQQIRDGLAADWDTDIDAAGRLIEAIEALVDDHWTTQLVELELVALRSQGLRLAIGRCLFDQRTPSVVVDRVRGLTEPA